MTSTPKRDAPIGAEGAIDALDTHDRHHSGTAHDDRRAGARRRHPERVVRSDPRAVAGAERGLHRAVRQADAARRSRSSSRTAAPARRRAPSIDGLEADVVTLALWPDTDAIRKAGLIGDGWEQRLPEQLGALHRTIVFVVRKGNPKGIKDWPDLVKPGVEIITPNPKTSGNGKLSFLAAWGSVTQRGGTRGARRRSSSPSSTSRRRCSTRARAARPRPSSQKKIGDVHLTWENEALPGGRGAPAASSRSSIRRSASSPSRRSPWSTPTSQRKGTDGVAEGLPRSSSTPPRARRSSPSTTTGRSTRRCSAAHGAASPTSSCSRSPPSPRTGTTPTTSSSPTAKIFDSIYEAAMRRHVDAATRAARTPPCHCSTSIAGVPAGLRGCSLGLRRCIRTSSLLGADPASACVLPARPCLARRCRRVLRGGVDAARARRLRAHLRRVVRRGACINVVARPAHRLGAGALRVSVQAAVRRARRPAVRAADGGGRAGLLEPVRARTAGSGSSWCRSASRAPTRGWRSCWC